jgi:uncharacterized protein (UPF0548 family)
MTDLTYPEHGATRSGLPPGYRHVVRHVRIGAGEATFDRAVAAVFGWRVHRGAGLTVLQGPRPVVDAVVVIRLGPPVLGPVAPCRVVYVVDEPRRRGFAYGTITGHPFSGEESFVVEWADDDGVYFDIRAFSRPATLLVRLAAPVVRLVQNIVTDRFVRALREAAGSG